MERPILFNTEMVQAILEGRKTTTRRIVKPQPNGMLKCVIPHEVKGKSCWVEENADLKGKFKDYRSFEIGDVLYVRETFFIGDILNEAEDIVESNLIFYRADKKVKNIDYESIKWRPSLHMPKKLARIFLKVTDVRVERLREMSEKDAEKEGAVSSSDKHCFCLRSFIDIWNNTLKKDQLKDYGWEVNPWVWVIEFERVDSESN